MIKDICYLVLHLTTELCNYLLFYILIFGEHVTKSKKKRILTVSNVCLFHLIVLFLVDRQTACAFSIVSMLVIPIFLLETLKKKNIYVYPFVIFGSSVFGIGVSFILAFILDKPAYLVTEGNWMTLVCQSMQIVVFFIWGIFRSMRLNKCCENDLFDQKDYEVNLDLRQYILFYVVVICLFFSLAPLQTLTEGYVTTKTFNTIGMASSVSCIVLVVLTILQGIVVKRDIKLQERNKQNEKYMKLQKEYYTELLQQDEKMRRFRHDMKTHIIALQSYCESENNSKMKEYLQDIVKGSAIYEIKAYTGNRAVDAVIRQICDSAEKNKIKVEINGGLSDNLMISDFDLCVVLSNLLKNALEACEKIKEREKCMIMLNVGMYQKQIYISVKNTVTSKIRLEGACPKSTKEKSLYHGLGSGNVANIVKKYKGMLEYKCDDEWFEVEISI